jgi:predicted DNA-binding WGR domain protein
MPSVDRDQILLTHPGTSKPKYLELRIDGVELHRNWWAGTGKPQGRTKSFDHERAAREALEKVVAEKMREGYALLRDIAATEPGDVVVQCAMRATHGVVAIALHPDGHTVAVARGISDQIGKVGSDVQTVDLRTGARQVMYTDAYQYSLIHTVAFEPDGSHLMFTVRDTITMVEVSYTVALATGHVQRLPDTRPGWDTARQRMLVVDNDDALRVLGQDGGWCLDLPAGKRFQTTATLSPSGRLVGLTHDPDNRDTEYDLEIWDVDTGQRVLAAPFPFPAGFQGIGRRFDKLAFDGAEQILVASGVTSGCFGVSVESGALCWAIEGKRDGYERLSDFALSPDGTLLAGALPGGPVIVHDVATGQPLEPHFAVPGGWSGWYQAVGFSADGRFLAVGDYPGRVTVFRFDGVEFTKPGG